MEKQEAKIARHRHQSCPEEISLSLVPELNLQQILDRLLEYLGFEEWKSTTRLLSF